MTDSVRIAFFGNGFARKVMLPCLRQVEGIQLVGLASPTLERAEATAAEFGIERVSSDHVEILEKARPDLVFITTPPHRHYDQSRDTLEAGAHVVCEKPMALSAAESAAMVELSSSHPDRLALLDHELRYDPKRRQIERWLADGRFGQIHHASYVVDTPGRLDPTTPWTWWSDESRGGGMLGALGSHAVDAIRSFLGEFEEVRGTLAVGIKERTDPLDGQAKKVTADDHASACLRLRSGAIVDLRVSGLGGERNHAINITGETGAVAVTEQGELRASFTAGAPLEVQTVPDELESNEDLGIPNSDWARNFLRYSRKIVAAVRAGQSTLPGAATFVDGHETQKVLDAIRVSHHDADWVSVQ